GRWVTLSWHRRFLGRQFPRAFTAPGILGGAGPHVRQQPYRRARFPEGGRAPCARAGRKGGPGPGRPDGPAAAASAEQAVQLLPDRPVALAGGRFQPLPVEDGYPPPVVANQPG